MREEWTIQSPCLGLTNKDQKVFGTTIIDPQTVPSGGKYAKIQLAGERLLSLPFLILILPAVSQPDQWAYRQQWVSWTASND
jgi:hypothetical protein